LRKTEKLNEDEWKIMKLHPVWEAEMLSKISSLKGIPEIIRHHYERWDGKGYSDGFAGENIPLFSRILGLADSFQAMISERSYRKALPTSHAIEEIKSQIGKQFDPKLAKIFIEKVITSIQTGTP